MGAKGYQEKVKKGAAALVRGEDANWELARLTFEACGVSHEGRPRKGQRSLAQWATDVRDGTVPITGGARREFSTETAGRYRLVWERYGDSPHSGEFSWSNALLKVAGDTREARVERYGKVKLKQGLKDASPKAKREALDALLAEPDAPAAIAAAMAKPEMRKAVTEETIRQDPKLAAQWDRMAEPGRAEQVGRRASERFPGLADTVGEASAIVDLTSLAQAHHKLTAAWRTYIEMVNHHEAGLTGEILAGDIFLRPAVQELHEVMAEGMECLERMDRTLERGQGDLDAFVSQVLQGGN